MASNAMSRIENQDRTCLVQILLSHINSDNLIVNRIDETLIWGTVDEHIAIIFLCQTTWKRSEIIFQEPDMHAWNSQRCHF